MTIWTRVEVLEDLSLRFICVPDVDDPQASWYVDLGLDENRWLADPFRWTESPAIVWFDVESGERGNGPSLA